MLFLIFQYMKILIDQLKTLFFINFKYNKNCSSIITLFFEKLIRFFVSALKEKGG
ncbi:hypothetical protein BN1002_01275 [Bacillus sp. B-jedd]|nr:hypothetical protein BN1002_01275 [Bacillus sp. B-jedd]